MTGQNEQGGNTCAAIIVAAGSGSRSGLATPKQYALLCGRAVVAHSYAALKTSTHVGQIVLVIGEGQEEQARAALRGIDDHPILVTGGETRRDSVAAGLSYLAEHASPAHVLIHDAARPFIPDRVIETLVAALSHSEGAIPTLPVADTLVRGHEGSMGNDVNRSDLYRVQTPQAFHFESVYDAHRRCDQNAIVTDDASLLRLLGIPVVLVEGDSMLEKLTYPADFDRAESVMTSRRLPHTGMGFDVHRLNAGKPLWLCGVTIPHSHGLSGHSDADVAIHALVDALLGALAEGDIGSHFPPSDPQWKGTASHQFLTFARDRVTSRGGEIVHVDVTIICEAPKIGPHRDVMRARLAELLDIPATRISVKATTTEKLGTTGRKEGIAAQAVATVMLPAL